MIFLIEYSRSEGRIIGQVKSFDESARTDAAAQRLARARELELHRQGIEDHEIVLLDADNLETLRLTHGRYFRSLEELSDLAFSLDRKTVLP